MCDKKYCGKCNYKPLDEIIPNEIYEKVRSVVEATKGVGITIEGTMEGNRFKLRAKKEGKEPIGSAIYWPHTAGERQLVIVENITRLMNRLVRNG